MTNSRYQKVLLVVPPMVGGGTTKYSRLHLPTVPVTGIAYLSEFLTYHGIDNEVMDLGLYYKGDLSAPISVLRQRIKEVKPDLVGLQVMTYRRDTPYRIIEQIRSPDYDIVIGGAHPSTVRAQVMDEVQADFAIKLEGEYTLLELCQGKELDKIDNLIFRDGDQVIENKDRPFMTDLDSIPFPRYKKFELDKYTKRCIPIVSSRGCPYQCIFCSVQVAIGRQFRVRSAENVLQEIMYWLKEGYHEFDFVDDNLVLQKERIYQFCDLIERQGLCDLKLSCSQGIRADRVDRELLKRMREVGFYRLGFGAEAGNDRVLKTIKKGQTLEQLDEAVRNACELGYDVALFFMIGHPGETVADVRESFNFALKYPISAVIFNNIVVYPQTELFEWIKTNSYFVGDWRERLNYEAHMDDMPFFETPELPLEERRAMLREGEKVAIQIKKKALLRSVRKLGVFGHLIAAVVYNGHLYPHIVRLYKANPAFNSLINWIIRLGIIKIYHL